MLTLRDFATALIGGFLAASVAYAAGTVTGATSPAAQHQQQHAVVHQVSAHITSKPSAVTS